ncbi:hypothetical protein Mapa_005458 [Marchantia paleacea]|nr:hypothetical protein Mapa_005458 [Marchantia paleacea]
MEKSGEFPIYCPCKRGRIYTFLQLGENYEYTSMKRSVCMGGFVVSVAERFDAVPCFGHFWQRECKYNPEPVRYFKCRPCTCQSFGQLVIEFEGRIPSQL